MTYGAKRGPKNKPIEHHKLHGTFRPSRHGPESHPLDDLEGFPVMPDDLPEEAKKLWKRIVPQLVKTNVAVEIDSEELAAMCRWWAIYKGLIKRVETETPYDPDSEIHQWRLEKRAKSAWQAFDSIACRFGMTPADRARLRAAPGKKSDDDPFTEFGIEVN